METLSAIILTIRPGTHSEFYWGSSSECYYVWALARTVTSQHIESDLVGRPAFWIFDSFSIDLKVVPFTRTCHNLQAYLNSFPVTLVLYIILNGFPKRFCPFFTMKFFYLTWVIKKIFHFLFKYMNYSCDWVQIFYELHRMKHQSYHFYEGSVILLNFCMWRVIQTSFRWTLSMMFMCSLRMFVVFYIACSLKFFFLYFECNFCARSSCALAAWSRWEIKNWSFDTYIIKTQAEANKIFYILYPMGLVATCC